MLLVETADLFREDAIVETCQLSIPEKLRLCGLMNSWGRNSVGRNVGRNSGTGEKVYSIVDGETSHGPEHAVSVGYCGTAPAD